MTLLAPALLALALVPWLAGDPLPDRPGHVKSTEDPFAKPLAGDAPRPEPPAGPASEPGRAADPVREPLPAPGGDAAPASGRAEALPPAEGSIASRPVSPRPRLPLQVTVAGAGALGPGGVAGLAEVGYPRIAATYAQGLTLEDDLGGTLRVDWSTGEMLLGVAWRRELSRVGGSRTGFRLVAGPWFDFGGTWIYPDNRYNLGLQVSPGIAWTAEVGGGLLTVAGDLPLTWAWQRGMGVALAPVLSLAYEVPVLRDLSLGARAELTVRWGAGSAAIPGLDSHLGAGLAALLTWRTF